MNSDCSDLKTQASNQAPGRALPKLAYSVAEAAAILGVSRITVYRLLQRGILKSSKALRTKLISHIELNRFLDDTTNV